MANTHSVDGLVSVAVSALIALLGGGIIPAAVAAPSPSPGDGSAASQLPLPLWWGSLTVAREGTDLMTVTVTPQWVLSGIGPSGPGTVLWPGVPGLTISPQWVVFGTCTRVGSPQPGFVAGTIGSDGSTTLRFYSLPTPPLAQQQAAVGVTSLGSDGLLHGSLTVVQGPDLNDTFNIVPDHP